MSNDERLYSRYAIEYAAEHAHSQFEHYSCELCAEQEEASCGLRNLVVDRQNEADGTDLPYFDDMCQKKPELRFDLIHDEAMEAFPIFHERQWFLDEVRRLQDKVDAELENTEASN